MLSLTGSRTVLGAMSSGVTQSIYRLPKPMQYLQVTQGQGRPYHTSIADRSEEQIKKIFDVNANPLITTMKQNYFFAPDFAYVGRNSISNFDIAKYLIKEQGILPQFISLIVSSDNQQDPMRQFKLEEFLHEYPDLDQVILVKGSGPRARDIQVSQSSYTDIAKIITRSGHDLGAIVNLYQHSDLLLEELRRKEDLGAVSYLSQPIVNPSILPPENREIIEEMMGDTTKRVSVGVLNVNREVYAAQRLESLGDPRVTSTGRDRYLMPEWSDGISQMQYNQSNIEQTKEWIFEHMKNRRPEDLHRSIYTRVGLGHGSEEARLVLSMLEGSVADASVRNPYTGRP